jgi:hypothetical protein
MLVFAEVASEEIAKGCLYAGALLIIEIYLDEHFAECLKFIIPKHFQECPDLPPPLLEKGCNREPHIGNDGRPLYFKCEGGPGVQLHEILMFTILFILRRDLPCDIIPQDWKAAVLLSYSECLLPFYQRNLNAPLFDTSRPCSDNPHLPHPIHRDGRQF